MLVPMSTEDILGPIDFVLLEFPADRLGGATTAALLDLVEQGIVRVYDLLIIEKFADGSFAGLDINDLDSEHLGGLTAFAGARSGLLGDDDIATAAEALQAGTVAALIVYENSWAIPFVAAARSEGGELVAGARIPAQDINDALDALEQNS